MIILAFVAVMATLVCATAGTLGVAGRRPGWVQRRAGASPLEGLDPPRDQNDWDEPGLEPPAQTGVHVIDDLLRKLHTAAADIS